MCRLHGNFARTTGTHSILEDKLGIWLCRASYGSLVLASKLVGKVLATPPCLQQLSDGMSVSTSLRLSQPGHRR